METSQRNGYNSRHLSKKSCEGFRNAKLSELPDVQLHFEGSFEPIPLGAKEGDPTSCPAARLHALPGNEEGLIGRCWNPTPVCGRNEDLDQERDRDHRGKAGVIRKWKQADANDLRHTHPAMRESGLAYVMISRIC